MNPDDAVRAHLDLRTPLSVGTHLGDSPFSADASGIGCFRLTDEGIDDPVIDLAAARRQHALAPEAFQVLETGETRIFYPVTPGSCRHP